MAVFNMGLDGDFQYFQMLSPPRIMIGFFWNMFCWYYGTKPTTWLTRILIFFVKFRWFYEIWTSSFPGENLETLSPPIILVIHTSSLLCPLWCVKRWLWILLNHSEGGSWVPLCTPCWPKYLKTNTFWQ
jgi:hypothetical protein